MAIIHTYQAGFCTHPECMVIKGGRMQVCQFPAYVFLLQVADKLWLWDTGYAEHFFDATTGIYQLYKRITPVNFDPADAIVNQLSHNGIAVNDLSGVILSHFHADHIAGIKDFVNHKHQTTLIVSQDGWEKVKPLKGVKALMDGFLPKLIPSQMQQHLKFIEGFEQIQLPETLAPFTTGYVLPESNGEIILVELAGHAHGHFGAFIQTNNDSGWTLIASDSAWLPDNYQKNLMPSVMANTIMSDVTQYKDTLFKLHTFYKARPDVPIILSHS